MSYQISYKKQILFGIILLLSIFLIIESMARAYDFFNPYCNLKNDVEVSQNLTYWQKTQICHDWMTLNWYWDDKTDVYKPEPNQHKTTVNINEFGFRGDEISQDKDDSIFRIFVLGGSTTINLRSISDEKTLPGYLQNFFNINKPNQKFEVINAGIPRISSTQELSIVENKLINFQPDMIIIYDGTNDLELPYGHTPSKNDLRAKVGDFIKRIFPYWETGRVIFNIIDKNSHSEESYSFDLSSVDKKVNLWKNNIEQICLQGKANTFDTVIILQPILGTGERILTQYEKNQFLLYDQGNALIGYDKFGDELNNLNEHCTIVKDFRNVFDNQTGSIFYDNAHIKFQANEIVAEEIFKTILPLIDEKSLSINN